MAPYSSFTSVFSTFCLPIGSPEPTPPSTPWTLDLSHADVTTEQRQQLCDLFTEFQDRISTSSYDLGSYDHTQITIKTTSEIPPSRYRPTRIPARFQKELDDHINKLLAAGRIVESDTPWLHNTVLVKKKDGSLRVCLDFRPLNDITVPDRYPLPRIEDLLERVAGKRYYTSFDLASGYMQLLLSPESQAKCGWATHRGIYQFVYLPFGLRNAGAYFCRAMSRILAGLDNNCLAYLDDIIVFDSDFDAHLQSLRKVLERFRIFNIKVSGKKLTSIAQSKITFLGHEISGATYAPAERNLQAIRDLPAPTTVKAVKGFLGKVGAALLQIHDPSSPPVAIGYFSKTLSPSQQKWSPTHIELFAMISALRFFRPTIYGNHTRVLCDHQPLTFLLRHRKPHDNLARWVVELQSFDITIEYHKGSSNVVADHLSRHASPDNRFVDGTPASDDIIEFPRCLVQRALRPRSSPNTSATLTPPLYIRPYDALLAQKQDPLCRTIMHVLDTNTFPPETPDKLRDTCNGLLDHCVIKSNGCLYFVETSAAPNRRQREAIFVPQSLREPICVALHDSPTAGGHFGWKKTLAKISRRFFWPTMRDDVFRYVRSCDACQRKRPHPYTREALIPVHTGAIFDKVYMDLSGPYHQSSHGNKYILCLIDHFSKYVVAVALPDSTAITVAHAIMTHCVLIFGAMTTLVSDNASYLRGELLTELGKLLHIGRYFTTPYHHEGNGACERMFATFQEMLRTYISSNQTDWDQFLPACTLAYNTSVHASTNESPFFLMFGRDPILNIDLLIRHQMEGHIPSDDDCGMYKESLVRTLHACWTAASAFNQKRSEAMKRQYDKNGLPPLDIKIGDRVYLRDYTPKPGLSPKLCYPWLGQFRVLAVDHPHLTVTSITSPQGL
uniref:RNA-directed DNA polymerase n=1 Tax=Haemonchus placei TaxID=6290 RepID=A0A0N4X776_HAEPC